MDAGILPVKRLDQAKRRLGADFDDAVRMEIVYALLEDSLDLCRSSGFLTWWVVSDDPEVLEIATSYGLNAIQDQAGTLNGAVQQAATLAAAEGARSVTVIPADVPLAYSGDIRDIVDTGASSDIVLVPSQRDRGTNALYMSPPGLIEPRFGTESLRAHISLAERLGYRCSLLVLPRLALDIDTVEDIDLFFKNDKLGTSRTAAVLKRVRPDASPS